MDKTWRNDDIFIRMKYYYLNTDDLDAQPININRYNLV